MPLVKNATRLNNAVSAGARAFAYLDGATPHRVVARRGPARLRYYEPAEVDPKATPVLLVTPIINRFRVVDLEPEASLVASLIEAGIPVYLVDWGQPARIDQDTDWDDYVLLTLPRFRRAIPHEGPIDVIGYCLGGTISTVFAARFPEAVRKFVTLNTPVDFHTGQPHMDLLGKWVDPEHFPVEEITGAFGNMPGSLIAQGFVWQRPTSSASKMQKAWERFEDAAFAEYFTVLESWNQDGVDVPGAAYRTLINRLYRQNDLIEGRFELRGQPIDLSRIDMPTLVVTSSFDTTCPPAAAHALLDVISSADKDSLDLKGGHITAIVGRKAKARLHAPLCEWLAK